MADEGPQHAPAQRGAAAAASATALACEGSQDARAEDALAEASAASVAARAREGSQDALAEDAPAQAPAGVPHARRLGAVVVVVGEQLPWVAARPCAARHCAARRLARLGQQRNVPWRRANVVGPAQLGRDVVPDLATGRRGLLVGSQPACPADSAAAGLRAALGGAGAAMLVAASLRGLLELALDVVEVVAALVRSAGERRAVRTSRRAGLLVASRAADLAAGRVSAGARLRPRLLRLASGACRRRPRAWAVSAGLPGPATGPRGAGAGPGVRHSDAGRALVVGGAPAAAEARLREPLALVVEGLERLDAEDCKGHLDVHLLELVGVEVVFGDPQVVFGAPVVARRALLH